MTAKEFFFLVATMREAQREYYKIRDPLKLRVARALEGDVDREIRRVKSVLSQSDLQTSQK